MRKKLTSVLVTFTLLLLCSCNSLQNPWGSIVASDTSIAFEIGDLSTIGQAKNINIAGKASLPDGTQLTVSAIRILKNPLENDGFDNNLYAILDRQFAIVENEQWRANLELQEKGADGSSLEGWQFTLNPLKDAISPSKNVIFTVSLEPSSIDEKLEEVLSNSTINDGSTQLSYTAAGEPYLQVSRVAALEVPANVSAREPADYTEIWQARSDYNPPLEESRNSVEMPFSEADNLPLPASNMLQ